ncbi:MAG: bifunctional methylenetetrahydrofolate dehydrogenase/methenyltetrahydrofolate cyclohydrolase FolD [Myxococcota bacterium]|nr:bifunctional methylenetetrahydrofolate dehydrogenase/methenyltetrahydrofolate cyclohydrolase FolD [Myxococcota bacterium]
MTAALLDGKTVARATLQALRPRIEALPRPPGIAVVRVGEDPASKVYVGRKTARAAKLGFRHEEIHLNADVGQAELESVVDALNADDGIDGILVQLPLPAGLDATAILDRIDARKDVDGFHPNNAGHLSQGRARFVPCTPAGVMQILAHYDVSLEGKHAVVIGRSNIVGRPMAMLLEQANCTVTIAHSRTQGLPTLLANADVVVAAVGRAHFVDGSWIRPGAVVIDVGINRIADGTLVGDVDTEAARLHARAITPVPGGVGPMTIAMLMANTVRAAEQRFATD